MKIKQIGIMGSAADLGYQKEIEKVAFELGKKIAKNNYVLIYGAEKDTDSLSTAAGRGAKSEGGIVTGVTYGNTPDIRGEMKKHTDVIINTGMQRGGGREFVLVSSCDAIITIGGGSGTLNEITIAYQKKIPIVCMKNTGGRSEKLGNSYLDDRYLNDKNRFKCYGAEGIDDAINYINRINKHSKY